MASQKFNIAVTGHRDLRESDVPGIEQKVREKLAHLIEGYSPDKFRLLSAMAEGADILVARIASELQIKVVAVVLKDQALNTEQHKYEVIQLPMPKDKAQGNEEVGKYLIEQANHLIALWDGVFNGKQGDTSEIIRMAVEGNKRLTIHHLVVPREQNPFQVVSLLPKNLDFSMRKFQKKPFAAHFSWEEIVVKPQSWFTVVGKFLYYILAKLKTELFLQFVLPMILVLSTLILGTIGFLQLNPAENFKNALFKSVNLITFNNSVIELKADATTVPFLLDIARFLGLLTSLTAFLIALYFALGNERKRLKLIFWKLLYPHRYVIVLGLSTKSAHLIHDLLQKRMKVAVLAPNDDSPLRSELERLGTVFIKGNISSIKLLQKIYYATAKDIYIMSDSDSDNVRAVQELDNNSNGQKITQRWYVHLEDKLLRSFLHNTLSNYARHRMFIFDVYENIARRIQLYHPMDKFYQRPHAKENHIVVFGYENLGKQIVINTLRQGHFEKNKKIKISVFCKNATVERERFIQEYPIFSPSQSLPEHLAKMKDNIWYADAIEFHELSTSTATLLDSKSVLFKSIIHQEHVVSLYVCFENGLDSGGFLATILPKLDFEKVKKNCNLQVYCFYNFPDKKEEKITERHFNKLAPNLPVSCFGNFVDECSVDYISDLALDVLPKQIAYWYEQCYGDKSKGPDDVWLDCSEQDKDANRQAADHLWVKLRTGSNGINWQFDAKTFEPLLDEQQKKEYELILSEIEHRRWSANLLLNGFKPLYDEANSPSEIEELKEFWFNKGGKRIYKAQNLHIDLRPFDDLEEHEKGKDLAQIRQIPNFLRGIVQV